MSTTNVRKTYKVSVSMLHPTVIMMFIDAKDEEDCKNILAKMEPDVLEEMETMDKWRVLAIEESDLPEEFLSSEDSAQSTSVEETQEEPEKKTIH